MKGFGFSLLELIISLALISLAVLLVVATFTRLLRPSQKASDLAAGTLVAQTVLDEEIYAILDNNSLLPKATFLNTDSPPNAPLAGVRVVNGTEFAYRIYYQTVNDIPAATPLGGAAMDNRVKKVDVVVFWWNDNAGEVRQGYGTLQTTASQLFLYQPDI